MKKLSHNAGIAVSWFFCGCAFMYLLVIVGVITNFIQFNVK